MDLKALGFYVLDRFKEPSTYAGITGLVLAAHISGVTPELTTQLAAIGMAGASALSVVLKEGK